MVKSLRRLQEWLGYSTGVKIKMKCKKCINGIIMKQVAISDWSAEPCSCLVENWFKIVKGQSPTQ